MHTWKLGDTTFTGNSDLSGKLTITPDGCDRSVEVPAADVLALAAQFVRTARISALEQSDVDQREEIARLEQMDDRVLLGVDRKRRPA